MNVPFEKPFFNSFLVKKEFGKLIFHDYGGYETRNESSIKLIKMCDAKFNLKNFDWILVNTDDKDHCTNYNGIRTLSYCTRFNNYINVCPDFLFDSWVQCGIYDYEDTCFDISLNGEKLPESECLGWIGVENGIIARTCLRSKTDGKNIDARFMQWSKGEDQEYLNKKTYKLASSDYISIPDHSKKWRYLIDVEGKGWSARLKMLMFSKRVLFIVDRPYKEWFFPQMVAWEHYVPVNRDCSNLLENLNIIKTDVSLEKSIIQNSYKFAKEYLTRESAINRWKTVLNP